MVCFLWQFWAGKISKKMSEFKKLYRSREKKICGVCGGLADYFDLDPTIIRLLWVVLSFLSCSVGIIAYFVCALIVPEQPFNQQPPQGDQQP